MIEVGFQTFTNQGFPFNTMIGIPALNTVSNIIIEASIPAGLCPQEDAHVKQ
jgi:hypothetical protein